MNLCYCNKTINDVYYQGCPVNTIYYRDTKVYEKPKGCFYISSYSHSCSCFAHTPELLLTCNYVQYRSTFDNLTNRPLYLSANITYCTRTDDFARTCVGWTGTCMSESIKPEIISFPLNVTNMCISNCLIQPGNCLIFSEYASAIECKCGTCLVIGLSYNCDKSDGCYKDTYITNSCWCHSLCSYGPPVCVLNTVSINDEGFDIIQLSLKDENGKVLYSYDCRECTFLWKKAGTVTVTGPGTLVNCCRTDTCSVGTLCNPFYTSGSTSEVCNMSSGLFAIIRRDKTIFTY